MFDLKLFFQQKFGLKRDSSQQLKPGRCDNNNLPKTQVCYREDAILFAYSSRKDEFSYPVHTFTTNISQNYNINIGSNRLMPLPESCTASFIETEVCNNNQNFIPIDEFMGSVESLDSEKNSHFDIKVWQKIMKPLEFLEEVFSDNEERWFDTSNEVRSSDKIYVTKIPAELIASKIMNYCSRQLVQTIPSSFAELKNLTILQLCCNSLTALPPEICLLRRLETLSLSNNKLKSLPSTIGYLINLENLHLDRNLLATLPRSISGLTKLKVLSIAGNEFREIPRSVMLLNRLVTFECDRNHNLRGVPSEITRFSQLARFHVEECPRLLKESEMKQYCEDHSTKGIPSLLECSARSLIRHRRPINFSAPRHIKLYLSRAEECSFCSGPMIDARVTYCRTIKRIDRPFTVIDNLCCSHWTDEQQRHEKIFSASPLTTPPLLISSDRRNRVGILTPFNQFDPERSTKGRRILKKFKIEDLGKVMVPLSLIVDWPKYPTSEAQI